MFFLCSSYDRRMENENRIVDKEEVNSNIYYKRKFKFENKFGNLNYKLYFWCIKLKTRNHECNTNLHSNIPLLEI
jgi:hypothetical protein